MHPYPLHAILTESRRYINLTLHDTRARTETPTQVQNTPNTSRNAPPSSTLGACSKSVSALTLFARGDAENVNSWITRVFDGDTTTASGNNRKLGTWALSCAET